MKGRRSFITPYVVAASDGGRGKEE